MCSSDLSLADCLQVEVPRDLLIPILPWNRSFSGGKGQGKAPAKFNPASQSWEGLAEWQRGALDPQLILRPSDEAECNAGLLLGAPSNGFQFIAIDIDLDEGPRAPGIRNGIVRLLQRRWNQTLLVRETLNYRALVLANLPIDEIPGGKKVFTLNCIDLKSFRSSPTRVGKLEILSHGQQAVISGIHTSGRRIFWYYENGDGRVGTRFPAPPIKAGVPVFPTFDAIVASVACTLDEMAELGFSYTTVGTDSAITGPPASLFDLAAPSVDELVNLLDQMPNPPEVDRDVYISILMAISGARAGLVECRGALSPAEDQKIANAVASWATRWQAPNGLKAGSFEEELAKWAEDIGKPKDKHYAGWHRLLAHAQSVRTPQSVLNTIATNKAQAEFAADTTVPPPPSMVVPGKPVMTAAQMMTRQSVSPEKVETSDIGVAERLVQEFSGIAVWVPGSATWLAWDDNGGWKNEDTTESKVNKLIVDKLWWYCGMYGRANSMVGYAGWDKPTHNQMMSRTKTERVGKILKDMLAKPLTAIDNGILKLQTPYNMYDLVTMEALDRKSVV